jgi:hypothetical protein
MRTLFFLPFLLLAGCAPSSSLPPPVAARQPVAKVPEGVPDGYEVALLDPAAAAQLPSDYKKAPNGLGDFLFGMTVAEAEAKCREVGGLLPGPDKASPRWASTRICRGEPTGLKIEGLPIMFVGLNFCTTTGRLCEVNAWTVTTDIPRTDGSRDVSLLSANLFGIALERRFGPPTDARESPLSDACVEGRPHAADLPGPYWRDWSWSAPVSRVRAVFHCDETDHGFYMFAADADGVGARLAKP